jgi:hypothetical protein
MPSLSQRPSQLTAEILDTLPPDCPEAIASRRDLRLFNAALGNWSWFERTAPKYLRHDQPALEIGAGLGELATRMQRLGLHWDGLDRAPPPPEWPPGRTWHQVDVFQFEDWERYRIIAGNLVFHHFDADQLRHLGEQIDRHSHVLLVGDLKRGRVQQWIFAGLARLVRANKVSRHDGWLSIQAGFRGSELPRLLGLSERRWTWHVQPLSISAYRLVARRLP